MSTQRKYTHPTSRNGIPMLPAEPFAAWIVDQVRFSNLHIDTDLADCDARAARRILSGEQETIGEHIVERVGIRVLRHPRLAPMLYPHLAEPVCPMCRVKRCWHITGRK